MNIDDPNQITPIDNSQPISTDASNNNDSGQSLADLVGVLQSVDTSKPEAALNAISIDGNDRG